MLELVIMYKKLAVEHLPMTNTYRIHTFRCTFSKYRSISQVYDWCEENIIGNWFRDENTIMYGVYASLHYKRG